MTKVISARHQTKRTSPALDGDEWSPHTKTQMWFVTVAKCF